jgi:DNA-binding beta-propeller fold protein YncE
MIYVLLLLGIAMAWVTDVASAAEAPLVLEAKIPLGSVVGRIDHLAVDLDRQRLFVAELGNGSVGVVDLKAGTVVHRSAGLKEPQGVGYFPGTDTLYIANAGDGSVRLYRGDDFAARGRIDLGDDADNVRVDESHGRVWIGYGNGGLAALDARNDRKIIDIPLKAHPESFRLNTTGATIYANVPDAGQIAIIDTAAGKQVGAIETHGARSNFPMALDAEKERILSVFRNPPRLIAYSTADGRPIATADVCSDADDVFLDAKRQRVYVTCGAGAIDVLADRGDRYERVDHVPTVNGARTSLYLTELDRLYVAVRAARAEPAAVWVFRPTP